MTAVMETRVADLVRTYQAELWRYLRYLGCDATLAEDLTQETFLTVMEKPFEERGDAQTGAYLRSIARFKFLRARRGSARFVDLDVADTAWTSMVGPDGGERYLDALRRCMEALEPRSRTAVDMRYRDGRSREEIATQLGLEVEGAKTLLRRAKQNLKDCVESRIGDERV